MDSSEQAYIGWILNQHQDKDFVQRIMKPNESPRIIDDQGNTMTHKMAYEKHGGGWIVFPTIMRDGRSLKDYGKNAMMEAVNRGEFIPFKTPAEAEWFSKNYKKIWESK